MKKQMIAGMSGALALVVAYTVGLRAASAEDCYLPATDGLGCNSCVSSECSCNSGQCSSMRICNSRNIAISYSSTGGYRLGELVMVACHNDYPCVPTDPEEECGTGNSCVAYGPPSPSQSKYAQATFVEGCTPGGGGIE